jgi:hypothetical protein
MVMAVMGQGGGGRQKGRGGDPSEQFLHCRFLISAQGQGGPKRRSFGRSGSLKKFYREGRGRDSHLRGSAPASDVFAIHEPCNKAGLTAKL